MGLSSNLFFWEGGDLNTNPPSLTLRRTGRVREARPSRGWMGQRSNLYLAWTRELQKLQQPVGESTSKILPQLVGELAGSNLPQPCRPWRKSKRNLTIPAPNKVANRSSARHCSACAKPDRHKLRLPAFPPILGARSQAQSEMSMSERGGWHRGRIVEHQAGMPIS